MSKLKVAVVGCGQIGPVHLRSYAKLPDAVEVAVVCDIERAKAEKAQADFGVKEVVTDYEAVLARDDIDAVSVCIPTHAHYDLVMAAARAGKHVFCEKPMAMSMEHALEMEQACREAGVLLQLGFVRRFDNEWMAFGDAVQKGRLGRPVVWRSATAGPGAPTPWFFQRDLGGGPLLDGAVHNYDFAHLIFGKARRVTANGVTIQPDRTAVDTGVAVIEYASGDTLQMMWSWGLHRGCRAGALHDVLGETGALLFQAPKKDPLDKTKDQTGSLLIRRGGDEEEAVTFTRNDMFADEIAHFVECIQKNEPPKVTAKHGQEALAVGLAVLESFDTGQPVELD